MRIESSNTLGPLADKARLVPKRAASESARVVRDCTIQGNRIAKQFAARSSGTHGKRYPSSFTWETSRYVGGFGAAFSGTYGPDSARPQGGMSFEKGSRHQPPHLDLAKSADVILPHFVTSAADVLDGLFW